MSKELHDHNAERWQDAGEPIVPEIQPGDPMLVDLSTVKPEPVDWLWPRRFPSRKVSCLAGDPGLGKSMASLSMAAIVTTGAPWPDGAPNTHGPAGVVLFSAEDDPADTLVPRLMAAGADLARVRVCEGVAAEKGKVRSFTLANVDALARAVDRTPDCRLVVIDPVTAYLGDIDAHRNDEVRALVAPISALAADRGVTVLCITHLNKSGGGRSVYRLTGSLALPAAARAVWLIAKDAEDPARRLMLPIKCNLGPDPGGLAYTISGDPPRVVWSPEPVNISADDALAAESAPPEPSKVEEAAAWLRQQLAGGPVEAEEMQRRAKAAGIAGKTLERAKPKAGVESTRSGYGGPWVWRLGEERHDQPKAAKTASGGGVTAYGESGGLRYGPGPETPGWAQ